MGHLALTEDMKNVDKIFIRKLEGKRPLRRLGCRWEDNIKMNLREIGCEGLDWIHLTQNRGQLWAIS